MAPSLPVSTRSPCEFKCFLLEGMCNFWSPVPCSVDEEKATLQCLLECRKARLTSTPSEDDKEKKCTP